MFTNLELLQTRRGLPSRVTPRFNVVSAVLLITPLLLGVGASLLLLSPIGAIVGALLGSFLCQAPKVAQQWEKAVVLRLGRYVGLR